MNLDPKDTRIERTDEGLVIVLDGERTAVHRVSRAFPNTDPGRFVSFLDEKGHEIGLLERPDELDETSLEILETELKRIYFVPLIEEILSVERQGTGTSWTVATDDGERIFRVQSRDMLNGEEAPQIIVTDNNGKRYRIEDFWSLDRDSRNLIKDMIPDKVLRSRILARRPKGMVSRMR